MADAHSAVEPGSPAVLLATLRREIDAARSDVGYQSLYEQWLCRDAWQLEQEALPLLVGVDPSTWPAYRERHALAGPARCLLELLAAHLGCEPAAPVEPRRLGHWAREHGIELPVPFSQVLDYLQRVLPGTAPQAPPPAVQSEVGDRERVLGAALALVTRFPDSCRGSNGMFEGARIVELMRVQAAVWFASGPPSLSDEQMTALLERYLS